MGIGAALVTKKKTRIRRKTRRTAAGARTPAGSTLFHLPRSLDTGPDILAVGSEADNAVCLTRGADAFLSRRIGNLKDAQSFDAFRLEIERLKRLARVEPAVVAHDMNPDCLAAKYAREFESVQFVPVQHHFAHVASCMVDCGETGRVLGVVYDESGYGDDGTIWGAEFLLATPAGYERLGHLRQLRWPGGERAARNPWRIAMTFIHLAYGYHTREIAGELFKAVPAEKLDMVSEMLEKGLHFPFGSSMGAFFDAVAASAGIRLDGDGRGLGAAALGSLAAKGGDQAAVKRYPYDILDSGSLLVVDPVRTIYDAVENALAGRPPEEVAVRFLKTVVAFTRDACVRLRERARTNKVVLTGELFRSRYLLEQVSRALRGEGFKLLTHAAAPPDETGISLGQACVARALRTAGKGN